MIGLRKKAVTRHPRDQHQPRVDVVLELIQVDFHGAVLQHGVLSHSLELEWHGMLGKIVGMKRGLACSEFAENCSLSLCEMIVSPSATTVRRPPV